ncbi:MAG: tyrosine-type recombinase/integrase, partial [Polyangiaceae bacterium]
FAIKYYDENGKRRKHWVPSNLPVPVTSILEAEAFAEKWYRETRLGAERDPAAVTSAGPVAFSPFITLEEFGRLWTSGKLASQFPDHVRRKQTAKDDEARLKTYVYPLIGGEELRAFEGRQGVELVERVAAGLPPVGPTFRPASRRQVLQAVHRLLTLAVYPAKIIMANPLPKGFVPRVTNDKAKTYLYPDEDKALMACVEVPLQERLFYGLLAREGMRVSELLGLTWANVDLARGVLTLDENKTDEPRAWAMDPGVVEALKRWQSRFVPKASPSVPVLADAKRRKIDPVGAAPRLRLFLRQAGVTRAQVFEASDLRLALRAHDLRATFVTVNLAVGKTEAWITDRTGHRSSQMIYRYKRAARTHAELELGGLEPLHQAIPELR